MEINQGYTTMHSQAVIKISNNAQNTSDIIAFRFISLAFAFVCRWVLAVLWPVVPIYYICTPTSRGKGLTRLFYYYYNKIIMQVSREYIQLYCQ